MDAAPNNAIVQQPKSTAESSDVDFFETIPLDSALRPICLQFYRSGHCRFKRCKLSHDAPRYFPTPPVPCPRRSLASKQLCTASTPSAPMSSADTPNYTASKRVRPLSISDEALSKSSQHATDSPFSRSDIKSLCHRLRLVMGITEGARMTNEEKLMKKAGAQYDIHTEKLVFPMKHINSLEKSQMKKMKRYHWNLKMWATNKLLSALPEYKLVINRKRINFHRFRPLIYHILHAAMGLEYDETGHFIYAETLSALIEQQHKTPTMCEVSLKDWGFRESIARKVVSLIWSSMIEASNRSDGVSNVITQCESEVRSGIMESLPYAIGCVQASKLINPESIANQHPSLASEMHK